MVRRCPVAAGARAPDKSADGTRTTAATSRATPVWMFRGSRGGWCIEDGGLETEFSGGRGRVPKALKAPASSFRALRDDGGRERRARRPLHGRQRPCGPSDLGGAAQLLGLPLLVRLQTRMYFSPQISGSAPSRLS